MLVFNYAFATAQRILASIKAIICQLRAIGLKKTFLGLGLLFAGQKSAENV